MMMTQLVADVGHNLPVPQAEGPAAIFRERRGFLLQGFQQSQLWPI